MSAEPLDVLLPKLGDTVTEGTISRWLVEAGDEVVEGQALAEIETDKVTSDYPSELAGTVVELLVPEGDTVPVGAPILRMLAASAQGGAQQPVPALSGESAPASAPAKTPKPEPAQPAAAPARSRGPRATGAARGAAEGAAKPGELVIRLSSVRRAMAEQVARSWAEIPHALAGAEADVEKLLALRDRERVAFRESHGIDLSPNALIVAAIGAGLERRAGRNVDLGIAVAVRDGVIVPVLRDAGRDWRATAPELAELVERARSGRLSPDEVGDADSTVTNIGVFGGRWAQPIINRNQGMIISVGAIEERPRALPNGVGWSRMVPISLVYDARTVGPVEASATLASLSKSITALGADAGAAA